MDFIQSFSNSSSWVVLISTGILGLLAAAVTIMGFFFGKNQMPVEGRTILVTGASEGSGRSIACQLAAKGANVVIIARNVPRLESVVTEMKAAAKSPQTQRFHYIVADVSEPTYAARVVAEAKAWNNDQPPDIVWCAAGLSTPLLWTDDDALQAARYNMDVNYFGAATMAHVILREWVKPPQSSSSSSSPTPPEPKHIVFTSSVLALFSVAGYGPYTPTKCALRGLADTLATELLLYPDNPVRVHLVCPGTIDSPGLVREDVTKPAITLELEKDEPPQAPEEVARRAIAGLERGEYMVTVSLLGFLMRCAHLANSPRNNWFVDTIVGWLMPLAYIFVMFDHRSKIRGWAKKHGHPSTWEKKA